MKDVKGYEGLYGITSCGRVWSYRRKKFLKPCDSGNGYLYVGLHKDGEVKNMFIHRLVGEAYIENPNNLPEINHIDEIKSHNWINNLEWCDSTYNNNYGTRTEKAAKKLSMKIKCVETNEVFDSLMDCERKTGCSHGDISCHLRGIKCKQVKGLHFIKI